MSSGGSHHRWRVGAALTALALVGVAAGVGRVGDDAAAQGRALAACGTDQAPEVAAEPDGWPLHNKDLANTRHQDVSPIRASNIAELEVAWTHDVPGDPIFGNLTTNPVVIDGKVYTGALDGSIHVVELESGDEVWSVARDVSVFGPSGVAVGWGKVYGISATATVVAHDADSGAVIWEKDLLVANGNQVDVAPTLIGGCVLVATQGLAPGSRGTLYALDHSDGSIVWQFETVPDDFWGNKARNNGGGAWYPPAVDEATGESYWGTSNPWPAPGAPGYPAGSSRPGDNLYTNSALAIEADGDLRWYHQVFPHDIWDRDMVLTQLVDLPGGGRVVVHTGKGGRVLGYDPADGTVLWDTSVGMHQNDHLTTFTDPTTVMPGVLGGVETPPAVADGVVYLAVMNAPTTYDTPEQSFSLSPQLGSHPSDLVAIDASNGDVLWNEKIPGDALGGVTVVGDLLLTSTFDGLLLAYDRSDGREVWRHDAGTFVNGWPAVVGEYVVWPISGGQPSTLVAFRLPEEHWPTTSTSSTATTQASSTSTAPSSTAPTSSSAAAGGAGPARSATATPRFTS